MNAQVLALFVVVAAVTVSGQLLGAAVGQQQVQASAGTALNVAENDALEQQAALNKEARQAARLEAKTARQARKNQRQALKKKTALQHSQQLEAAEFNNAAEYNEVDAAADISKANRFGLQIVSENAHDESARLSKSSGSQFNTGSKIAAANNLNAADYHDEEAIDQAETISEDALSAANENEDILNAQEGLQSQNNFLLQAQDFTNFGQFGAGQQQQQGLNFGGNGLFGNNFGDFGFGRR